MGRRQNEGTETFSRLLDWTRGQTAAERLASQLLRFEGFQSIDPSHPLGGRDTMKDMICLRNGKKWIGAAYFPRGQQSIGKIIDKFKHDLSGVAENQVDGFAFVTNQELRLNERKKCKKLANHIELELLHLERVASILDSPQCYGIRLEFLDIEMTKEEQLAFIAARDTVIDRLQLALDSIIAQLNNPELLKALSPEQLRANIPLSEIREFKSILDSIVGFDPYVISVYPFGMGKTGHINDLQVPLAELKEFADILDRIAGHRSTLAGITDLSTVLFGETPGHVDKLYVPLNELREFAGILDRIAGNSDILISSGIILGGHRPGHVRDLNVPLTQLQEYEATLDRVIQKLQEKEQLERNK